MKQKTYFKIKIELLSPLSIGDSNSSFADKDIIMNSREEPVIPATSIAGVFRSLESDTFTCKEIFGDVEINTNVDSSIVSPALESAVMFYDARIVNKSEISIRDGIKLNSNKTSETGAKYDYQIVETRAVFIGYIETRSKKATDYVKAMLSIQISLGSKTTRGFGKVKISYCFKEFDLIKQMEEWLDFDMFENEAFDNKWIVPTYCNPTQIIRIKLKLKQKGGLSIRRYLTDVKRDSEEQPDYGPLTLKDNTPVIPGTSWAGMFKSQVVALLGNSENNEDINNAFGFVCEEEKTAQKSKVTFSESQLKGCTEKILVRNAIDRFTNGTKDGALYTEKTVYGGNCELEISIDTREWKVNKKVYKVENIIINAILATIIGINFGFVAVGGLTAVGRGLFTIKNMEINGKTLDEVDYNKMKEAIYSA